MCGDAETSQLRNISSHVNMVECLFEVSGAKERLFLRRLRRWNHSDEAL